jgi:O-antigen/teichoic acid export membrane protein
VASIAATFFTLRYEKCILLPKDETESVTLLLLSVVLIIVLGLITATVLWFLPDHFLASIGLSALGGWFLIAILAGMSIAIVATGTNWLNRQCAYVKMTKIRIMQTAVGAICGVTFGIYGVTEGLITAQIIALLAVAMMAIFGMPALGSYWKKEALLDVAVKHQAAPKYLLPAALFDVVTLQLPIFLIVAWFSTEDAGQFSMAWKIMTLPMALIGGAIGQVFLQRFSQVWPDAQTARKLLFQTWKVLALVGVLPNILVMIFGEQMFTWVLGNTWAEAGRMAAVLAPMLLAILVSSPTSGTFLVLGMQKHSLVFGIASLIYRPACLSVGMVTGDIFHGLLILVIVEIIQISIYQLMVLNKLREKII